MAQIPELNWLTTPEQKWLPCRVAGSYDPEGYAVQIQINGHSFAAVVPYESVRLDRQPPTDGKVRIVVLAEIGGGGLLAELPAAPVNGTQRVTVQREWLKD